MNYYSAINRNQVLTHATTGMKHKNHCEARHKRINIVHFNLYEISRIVKLEIE